MKTTTFLFAIVCFAAVASGQPAASVQQPLVDAIAEYKTTYSSAGLMAIAGKLERIAQAEPATWEARAWQAVCYLDAFYMLQDEKQQEALIEKAIEIAEGLYKQQPKNHEVVILYAFVMQGKANLNPSTSWMTLGPKVKKLEKEVEALNPNNPRLALKKMQNLYFTPSAFGGDREGACRMGSQVKQKFDDQVLATPIALNWGQRQLNYLQQQCQKAQ